MESCDVRGFYYRHDAVCTENEMGRVFHTAVTVQFLAMVFVRAFSHPELTKVKKAKTFKEAWKTSVAEYKNLWNETVLPAPSCESSAAGTTPSCTSLETLRLNNDGNAFVDDECTVESFKKTVVRVLADVSQSGDVLKRYRVRLQTGGYKVVEEHMIPLAAMNDFRESLPSTTTTPESSHKRIRKQTIRF